MRLSAIHAAIVIPPAALQRVLEELELNEAQNQDICYYAAGNRGVDLGDKTRDNLDIARNIGREGYLDHADTGAR